MKKKIFRNYLFAGVIVMIICCTLLLSVLFHYYEGEIFNQLSTETRYIVHGMELSGEYYMSTLNASDRVTWVAADGKVLYDSKANSENMSNHLNREEIHEALEYGSGQSIHYSETLFAQTLYYAEKMSDGTVVRVSCTQNSVMAIFLMLLWPLLGIVFIVIIICSLIAFRLSKHIVEPINQIDLDYPTPESTYPELLPLVTRIRQQNSTIHEQMNELGRRQREFLAITENMSEGFLLIDHDTNILSGNQTALGIINKKDNRDTDSNIENLKRDGCIRELMDVVDVAFTKERAEKNITLDGICWNIIATPVINDEQVAGIVVMFLDVTEKEQREELRREFSANVSHELKTPLTSISGFAELMMNGLVPEEKCREFAGDIYKQSYRLKNLVNDIIRLSRLEESGDVFEFEEVDLYELGEEVLDSLKPIADKEGIELGVSGSHLKVVGVWQILNEMVYNLCDNAIKYNKENGKVLVEISQAENHVKLAVSDTGIGIPYCDQERIFERFYRVDKSHSREMGGTGLGLSIVKHGAQYHSAHIELESTPGTGTTITVIFNMA